LVKRAGSCPQQNQIDLSPNSEWWDLARANAEGAGEEMDTGFIFRILVLIGVAMLLFVPTLWAIRDVAYRSFPTLKAKVLWFVAVTLLPPLGALVYIAAGRRRVSIEAGGAEDQDEPLMK
jgi:hypothetical protein